MDICASSDSSVIGLQISVSSDSTIDCVKMSWVFTHVVETSVSLDQLSSCGEVRVFGFCSDSYYFSFFV